MTIFDLMRNTLLAGFGMQEKVKELIEELMKKGELSESKGAKLLREWTDKTDKTFDQFSKDISEIFKKTMEVMNLPTKEDIDKLGSMVQTLSARIDKLEGKKE